MKRKLTCQECKKRVRAEAVEFNRRTDPVYNRTLLVPLFRCPTCGAVIEGRSGSGKQKKPRFFK